MSNPLHQAGERAVLLGLLEENRNVCLAKIHGLDHQAGTQRLVPSASTLLGLVSHLLWVERYWFRQVFNGEDVDMPWTEQNPDAEFDPQPTWDGPVMQAAYQAAIAESNAIIAAVQDLNTTASTRNWTRVGGPPSLRWILAHMIEETARHAGHLDILRELTDGSVGYRPEA